MIEDRWRYFTKTIYITSTDVTKIQFFGNAKSIEEKDVNVGLL